MTEFRRVPAHHYEDPLTRVWRICAEAIGFRIERSADVYASSDGAGTIFLGTDDILDPDDSMAQMIFHELCHALVEGESGERLPDWGLDNTSGRHTWREHACLRLQAYLSMEWGLREFFAPTTDFRVTFWRSLPMNPFEAPAESGGRRERSCVAARVAAWRAGQPRWRGPLTAAMEASAAIAGTVARVRANAGARSVQPLPSLYDTVTAPPPRHPAEHSFLAMWHEGQGCETCAWSTQVRQRLRCRHAPLVKLVSDAPACARWEAAGDLNCQACGACCREAYDSVELGVRDPFIKRHPSLVVFASTPKVARAGGRCSALAGGTSPTDDYACTVYDERPRTCRAFTFGSENCLAARQKVGLSL